MTREEQQKDEIEELLPLGQRRNSFLTLLATLVVKMWMMVHISMKIHTMQEDTSSSTCLYLFHLHAMLVGLSAVDAAAQLAHTFYFLQIYE